MTREEAIALGVEVCETQHSMKRRTPWHDYSRKGTYMLTLVVQERVPLLGTLKGILDATSSIDRPHVELSPLGKQEYWTLSVQLFSLTRERIVFLRLHTSK